MKFTIVKKGLILVSLPLVFQLAFIALVARIQQDYAEAAAWDNHTKAVIEQGEFVLKTLVDAETGARGFVITDSQVFVEPYDRATKELPGAIEKLQSLVQDNPAQSARVQRIQAAAERAVAFEAEVVAFMRQEAEGKAVAQVRSGEGKRRMDEARREIAQFLQQEDRLDEARGQQLEASSRHLHWVFIAGGCVAALTTLILAVTFSRSVSRRLSVLAENAKRLSAGAQLLSPVSGSDEIADLDRVFRDMATDLSRSSQALREQTQILESILTSMGDGVVVADSAGKFLVFNPAAEQILGRGPTDVHPERWTESYGVYQADAITPYPVDDLPLLRAIRGEAIDAAEMVIRHAQQPQGAWISVTGRPLQDTSGALQGGVIVFRDITESKRIADEIRRLNEELEQRVRLRTAALEEANRELAQKNQENEMFVYSVSHDLRSPLVNLQGFSKELILARDELRALIGDSEMPSTAKQRALNLLDGEMQEFVRFIQSAVLRLSNIIDALLRMSRAGRVDYAWQDVEVQEVVARIVDSMRNTATARRAKIIVHELPPAWGDPTAVEQCFANLIGNALNYVDPSRPGEIEIGSLDPPASGSPDAGQPSITYYVSDNGVGIAEAQNAKVFQALQRLHPQMAKGEGMGLAMTRRIVERHGGRIWFESTVGIGTTFFMTLPVARSASPDEWALGAAENSRRLELCQQSQ